MRRRVTQDDEEDAVGGRKDRHQLKEEQGSWIPLKSKKRSRLMKRGPSHGQRKRIRAIKTTQACRTPKMNSKPIINLYVLRYWYSESKFISSQHLLLLSSRPWRDRSRRLLRPQRRRPLFRGDCLLRLGGLHECGRGQRGSEDAIDLLQREAAGGSLSPLSLVRSAKADTAGQRMPRTGDPAEVLDRLTGESLQFVV